MLPLRTLSVGFVLVMQPACADHQEAVPDDSLQAASTPANILGPSTITAAQIALGDSIFQCQAAGGVCWTCHGTDAKGCTVARSRAAL